MKNVFVTGSSRGIGRAIAIDFAKNGYNVFINASKSLEELENLGNFIITNYNVKCKYFLGDVSNYDVCENIFNDIENNFGNVDVLINNCGISYVGLFSEMKQEDWQKVIDVNVNSVINCSHLAIKSMVLNKCGNIINISSIWGEKGASCEAIYSLSKGAVNSFTKSLAKELGPSNIRVNAISCGVINTSMNSIFDSFELDDLKEAISLMRFGEPNEVSKLALFLSDSLSSYITGQIINVDGCFF